MPAVMQLRPLSTALALALGLASALPASASDGLAGAYLAGRHASMFSDYPAAAEYYTKALARDPKNPVLLDSALHAQIVKGDMEAALPIAEHIRDAGLASQIANLAMMAKLGQAGDFQGVIDALDDGKGAGPLVDGLYRAWALLGVGAMSEATTAFDTVSQEQGLEAFALYHKALALASVGDFEGADLILSGQAGAPLRATRRGVMAHVQVLSQLERNPDALALINDVFGPDTDPSIALVQQQLEAGETLPFTLVTGAGDGLAEVFFTVASALNGEAADSYTLVYARLADYLRPGHADALLLLAKLFEEQGQYDLATAAYNEIPRDDPSFLVAELGRSDAMIDAGKTDAAIEVLEQLSRQSPDIALVHTTLGDTLRRVERYGDAIKAYDRAIALFDEPQEAQWVVYYARGVSYEREKAWDQAEADLKKALELKPDQPQVLNYLGYSYLEKNINLENALSMIERAVAARPGDGYITDSLGWGFYRMGRYKDAVSKMEQAVELMPVDSVVNDHLGDVYWAVGRKREAEFQWRRALSFGPDTEAEATRIRRKLEVGLDAVLKEEGAKPLAVSANGN